MASLRKNRKTRIPVLSDKPILDLSVFRSKSVLVVGDLILDHYLWGGVERTAFEAPVPVVHHERDTWILGAASNVAHNITALGGHAEVVGVTGSDDNGLRFVDLLKQAGIGVSGITRSDDRCTSVKTRVMSQGQQLLRIDYEKTAPLPENVRRKVLASIERLSRRCDIIILSDYAKGVVDREVVEACLAAAQKKSIQVLVDPKGRDYRKYNGVDVVKPNDRELALAVGRTIGGEEDLLQAGRDLMRQTGIKSLVVSRGAEGVAVLAPSKKPWMIPSRAREVFDINGAGDTLLATLSLSLASGLELEDAAVVANHAAGVVVGKLGVATVSPDELREALSGGSGATKIREAEELQVLLANLQAKGRKIVLTNGCFDLLHAGHIQFLHEAKRLGDVLVVAINSDRSVEVVKGPPRPILPQSERAAIISALQVVDYVVVFDELTPENLLRQLRPDVLAKGRNIAEKEVVGRDIVQAYGGAVKRLPILHPSTVKGLVDTITASTAANRKQKVKS